MATHLRFRWDLRKAARNLRGHRISFEDATDVFYDDRAVIEDDPDPDEERLTIIGMSRRGLLFVVYTERHQDTIRIISARKAADHEIRAYYHR
jgi:uncharacterized DUF497 family protein